MKYIIIVITIICISGCGAKWDKSTKELACAYGVLHTIDYFQTLEIASNENYYEINPYLGKNPSKEKVLHYFLATPIISWLITDTLPPKYRNMFLSFEIGVEGAYVVHNYQIGVRF